MPAFVLFRLKVLIAIFIYKPLYQRYITLFKYLGYFFFAIRTNVPPNRCNERGKIRLKNDCRALMFQKPITTNPIILLYPWMPLRIFLSDKIRSKDGGKKNFDLNSLFFKNFL